MIPASAWLTVSVTLAIFVFSHICITIWWASRVSTILDLVQLELKDVVAELKALRSTYVSKEDIAREMAITEKEHKALWKNVDELKKKVFG